MSLPIGVLPAGVATLHPHYSAPGATPPNRIRASASLDFAAPGAVPGFTAVLTIPATGAVVGDLVLASPSADAPYAASLFLWAYVSSPDTVSLKVGQLSGVAVNLAANTYRVDVWPALPVVGAS